MTRARTRVLSWPMIPGRPLAARRIESAEERDRIVRESDYNLDGKPTALAPNQNWQRRARRDETR